MPREYRHLDKPMDADHLPTPDPASPCGYPLELASGERHCPWLRSAHPGEPSEYDLPLTGHPYRPTRCTCGHPIEEASR